jgi:hypothetical protein
MERNSAARTGMSSPRPSNNSLNMSENEALLDEETKRSDSDSVPENSITKLYKRSTAFTILVQKYVNGKNWRCFSSLFLALGILTYSGLLVNSIFKDLYHHQSNFDGHISMK